MQQITIIDLKRDDQRDALMASLHSFVEAGTTVIFSFPNPRHRLALCVTRVSVSGGHNKAVALCRPACGDGSNADSRSSDQLSRLELSHGG